MNSHHFYNINFQEMLAIGKFNEDIISEEFDYQGIPLIRPPEGKQPFDRFLPTPTGTKSIEIKCDFRSQRTGCAAIEWPTLQRGADLYFHTLTSCLVFTHDQYSQLYMRGKIPAGGMGSQGYDGKYIRLTDMRAVGMPLYKFIDGLKQLTKSSCCF